MYKINNNIINNNNIEYKLILSSDFDKLLFITKQKDVFFEIFNKENIGIFKLIANKYEIITLENVNYNLHSQKKNNGRNDKSLTLENKIITIENNIFTVAGISLHPAINIENIKSIVYQDRLKYLSLFFNPYLNNITNKKICIIKQIGPWEIIDDTLNLYFQEEFFYQDRKNIVKTIFVFIKYNNSNNKYTKINNQSNFDFIIADEVTDKNITEYVKDCDIIIIDKLSVVRDRACINASISLIIYSSLINNIMKKIKNNTTIIFTDLSLKTLPQYQIFNILQKSFENILWFKNKLSLTRPGTFIFENYNKSNYENSILKNFIKEYKTYDKFLGKTIYTEINKNIKWCSKQDKIQEPIMEKIVLSLYYEPIDKNFSEFMKKVTSYNKKRLNKYVKHMNFVIEDTYNKEQEKYIISRIKSKLLYNIDKSIKLLQKYNLIINPIYEKNIINNSKIVRNMIHNIDSKLINKIHLSRDSIYSISKHEVAEKISNLIKKVFKITNIIDGTANIGGNTINFAKHFNSVLANEIEQSTFLNLKNNIEILNIKNVYLHNSDITTLFYNKQLLNKIKFNINTRGLFIDPPWSGIYYSLEDSLNLIIQTLLIL